MRMRLESGLTDQGVAVAMPMAEAMFKLAAAGPKALPRVFMDRLLMALDAFMLATVERYAAQGVIPTCKRGCSHCCVIPVGITPLEAFHIARFVAQSGCGLTNLRRRLKQNSDYRHDGGSEDPRTVKCVFLQNRVCSIYPVRPVTCRSYFSLCGADGMRWDGGKNPLLGFPVTLGAAVGFLLLRETAAPGASPEEAVRQDGQLLEDGVLAVLNAGDINTAFDNFIRRREPVFPPTWPGILIERQSMGAAQEANA